MADRIISHPPNEKYRQGWDRAFGGSSIDKLLAEVRKFIDDYNSRHHCGESGFGQSIYDECPACRKYEEERKKNG